MNVWSIFINDVIFIKTLDIFSMFRKGLSSRCWENLVLAMLGEQFMVGEEICGAVVSVRS